MTDIKIAPGDTLQASYEVTNHGTGQDTQDITLTKGGNVVATEADVTVKKDQTVAGALQWVSQNTDDGYEYSFELVSADSASNQFTVLVGADPPENTLYQYPIRSRSDSTIVETISSTNATAQGSVNVEGDFWDGYAERGDGSTSYFEFPNAIAQWADTTSQQWMAFTVDNATSDGPFIALTNSTSYGGEESYQIRKSGSEIKFMSGETGKSGMNARYMANTTSGPLTSGKHRIVFQKTATNSADLWVDGNQIGLSESTNYDGWQGFIGNPSNFHVGGLATLDETNTPQNYLDADLDNVMFGTNGTNLTSTEIQNDYEAQPWVTQ
jgi:hypothetical protein